MPFRKSLPAAGVTSGKNFSTGSSTLNLPSAWAMPIAVDEKLLVSENIWCGVSGANGVHQPSAITWPRRTTITLFIVSTFASRASMKASSACDDTPCDSGVARGSLLATGGSGGTLGPDGCAAAGAAPVTHRAGTSTAAAASRATARARDHGEPGRARRTTYGIEWRLLRDRTLHSIRGNAARPPIAGPFWADGVPMLRADPR